MPEGDTIHKLAAVLEPLLLGRRVERSRLRRQEGDPLAGRRVVGVLALGKHLFIHFEDGVALRTHLGLWGAWHRYEAGEPWQKPERQAAVTLWSGEEVFVCFNPREAEVVSSEGVVLRELRKRLGPDLTAGPVDTGEITARAWALLLAEAPLVDVLLDQRVACGIGNVYKSELLFLEGLPPTATLGATPDAHLAALYARAGELLGANVGPGPRTTRFEADGRGRLWVYGRGDAPCLRCGNRFGPPAWAGACARPTGARAASRRARPEGRAAPGPFQPHRLRPGAGALR